MLYDYIKLFDGSNAVINNSEVQKDLIRAGFVYTKDVNGHTCFRLKIARYYEWIISIYKNKINLSWETHNRDFSYEYDNHVTFQEQLTEVATIINRTDPSEIILFKEDFNDIKLR
jgi:hypothetical protein